MKEVFLGNVVVRCLASSFYRNYNTITTCTIALCKMSAIVDTVRSQLYMGHAEFHVEFLF